MENIWNASLNLKEAVKAFELPIHTCWMELKTGMVYINDLPTEINPAICILCEQKTSTINPAITTFELTSVGNLTLLQQANGLSDTILFLRKYLPYCFFSLRAKRLKRAISVTHFAQSLDAKIATNSGDSKSPFSLSIHVIN